MNEDEDEEIDVYEDRAKGCIEHMGKEKNEIGISVLKVIV